MPPVRTDRKPVGRSSKLAVCAQAAEAAKASPSVAAYSKLARKAFTGHGNLEMPHRWARLDDGERHQASDQHADHDDRHRGAKPQGGDAKMASRAEQGHGEGKLPGCRLSGNCP